MLLQAIIFHMSYGKKSIATGASTPAAQRHSTFAFSQLFAMRSLPCETW
jgi:hypothetical protein